MIKNDAYPFVLYPRISSRSRISRRGIRSSVVLITAGAPKIREKMLSGKSCSKEIREFK
jgi:hypothetical protein